MIVHFEFIIRTSDSGSSGGMFEILNLRCVMALPILTERGRHLVKKLCMCHVINVKASNQH